jgi:hypothetical protein
MWWGSAAVVFESGIRMRILLAVLLIITVGCSSQPRFLHVQGMPPFEMFDNKTGQTCVSDSIAYDSVEKIKRDMRPKVRHDRYEEAKKKSLIIGFDNTLDGQADTATDSLLTSTLDNSNSMDRAIRPQYKEFYDRYDALKANPNNPPVYHYDGMPYCKEL